MTNKTTPLWTFCVIISNSVPPVDLGRAPTRTFERYMNELCREWIYNCKQLQSIVSRFCGHYCACYCILRSKGIDNVALRLVLKFAQALADPVTVIAYAEFQNVIEIDRNRNVIYDFAV